MEQLENGKWKVDVDLSNLSNPSKELVTLLNKKSLIPKDVSWALGCSIEDAELIMTPMYICEPKYKTLRMNTIGFFLNIGGVLDIPLIKEYYRKNGYVVFCCNFYSDGIALLEKTIHFNVISSEEV